jgi:hypothetical protein
VVCGRWVRRLRAADRDEKDSAAGGGIRALALSQRRLRGEEPTLLPKYNTFCLQLQAEHVVADRRNVAVSPIISHFFELWRNLPTSNVNVFVFVTERCIWLN